MKQTSLYHFSIMLAFCWVLLSSCQQPGGNNPGSEFMPDMAHSIAYEANTYTYYYNNTWGSEDDYYQMAKPRNPVAGTVARGYTGLSIETGSELERINQSLMGELTNAGISVPINGHVPYAYQDTEEDRTQASADIIQSPYPITAASLEHGKEMYNIYCGICHGEKGDGQGYLVREDGGKYPAQPANLLLEQYVIATNGQYYHAIMYGKNLMGGYADKLSYEERWDVIHYIRSLQAKELKLAYNEETNTLNSWATPGGTMKMKQDESHSEDMEGHGDDGHGGEGHDDKMENDHMDGAEPAGGEHGEGHDELNEGEGNHH